MFIPSFPQSGLHRKSSSIPLDRRKTPEFHRKQRIVRDVWLCSGTVMLFLPVGLVYVPVLGTTFFSFMVLDETR